MWSAPIRHIRRTIIGNGSTPAKGTIGRASGAKAASHPGPRAAAGQARPGPRAHGRMFPLVLRFIHRCCRICIRRFRDSILVPVLWYHLHPWVCTVASHPACCLTPNWPWRPLNIQRSSRTIRIPWRVPCTSWKVTDSRPTLCQLLRTAPLLRPWHPAAGPWARDRRRRGHRPTHRRLPVVLL